MGTQETKNQQYTIGPWQFDAGRAELNHKDGHSVHLEEKIGRLLQALLLHRGEVVSKEQLINLVWEGRELSEQTIPVAISKLRKALGDDINQPMMLETIPRQGYRLLAKQTRNHVPDTKKWNLNGIAASAVAFALIALAVFWPSGTEQPEQIQLLNTEKPGIIVTINDVRLADEKNGDISLAIALSELSAYYLSQIPDLLVIRHWWNLDAPDPTGGIFTRYGPATPVYSLKGTLLPEGQEQLVTFVLSDPKTDEVIWSGLHSAEAGSAGLFPMFSQMLAELNVGTLFAARPAPDESTSYWRARYFYELSNPGAAGISALELASQFEADGRLSPSSKIMALGLAARWPDVPEVSDLAGKILDITGQSEVTSAAGSNWLVDAATTKLFKEHDAKQALNFLDEALSMAPGDHFAHAIKGEALAAMGQVRAALQSYQMAFRLAPYARSYEARLNELTASVSKTD